jgi:excisionase family DNA binding protein
LRTNEAAKALGISERLLWQLTKDGVIPCVRLGQGKRQTLLYPIDGIQRWLARAASRPVEPANGVGVDEPAENGANGA